MWGRDGFASITTSTFRHRESSAHRAALAGDQGLDPDYEPDLDWFKSPRKFQEERASHPHEYVSGDGYPNPDGYDPSQIWHAT